MKHKEPQSKANFALTLSTLWLILACQVVNVALLYDELSWWMLSMITLLLTSQALFIMRKPTSKYTNKDTVKKSRIRQTKRIKAKENNSPISNWLLILFAISGAIAITVTGKSLGVLNAMVHLLCFGYILKAFELKQRKDFYQLVLIGFFVLVSSFIFRQDLFFSLLGITALIVNLSLLYHYFSRQTKVLYSFKITALLLIQSSLLAILLFLFFPRIPPFWQVPSLQSATTGLSDSITPGDIAELAQSTDLAFRVTFDEGNIPSYNQLYWRAMVLEDYDGRAWRKAKGTKTDRSSETQLTVPVIDADSTVITNRYSYQVIAEASFQTWLFSLPYATTQDTSLTVSPDFTIESNSLITQPKAYRVTSYLSKKRDLVLSTKVRQRNLTYPENSNPRLESLGHRLKLTHTNPLNLAQAVLDQFRQNNYFYTLKPPLLNNNSLDEFFFETQAGFCSHYASAFTFVMRSAGIPSRVVTGYLGGEVNNESGNEAASESINVEPQQTGTKEGGHLNVYQYDAHAWAEIWVKGEGWVRVDPTSAVDPSRVSSGWSDALLQEQSSFNNDLVSLYRFKQMPWLNQLRLKYDAIDYQWTRWVVGYSTKKQLDLIKRWFGDLVQYQLALILIGFLASIMLLYFGVQYLLEQYKNHRRSRLSKTPVAFIIYNKALVALAKKGIVKNKGETVKSFNERVTQYLKDESQLSRHFSTISVIYTRLTYKTQRKVDHDKQLALLVLEYKRFKIANKIKGYSN